MFGRFMPQEGKFFEFFNEHAQYIVDGTRELAVLMNKFDDLERRAYSIETIEKKADKVTYKTVELLHKTFITPIDRDDIHKLITRMDDILDMMEDAAQTISLYDQQTVTPEAKRLRGHRPLATRSRRGSARPRLRACAASPRRRAGCHLPRRRCGRRPARRVTTSLPGGCRSALDSRRRPAATASAFPRSP